MTGEHACATGRAASPDVARQRARRVLSEWRGRGRIAVFGAGGHTRKILPVLEEHADRIAGITDDSPACWGRRFGPWTVGPPGEVVGEGVAGVLVSSDVQQATLAERVRAAFGRRCAILTLHPPDARGEGEPVLAPTGERQTGRTLEEVELGHRARYYWALQHLPAGAVVLDAACGGGYGSHILAGGGLRALGVDISEEAIRFARHHYGCENTAFAVAAIDGEGAEEGPAEAGCGTGAAPVRSQAGRLCHTWGAGEARAVPQVPEGALGRLAGGMAPFDAVVSLETLEHLERPAVFLRRAWGLLRAGGLLLCSTPNAGAMSLEEAPFHRRHFTREQMQALIEEAGFRLVQWYGQEGLQILRGRCTPAQRYRLYHAVRPA